MNLIDLPIPALKEEIGLPELFTGRRRDLAYFMDWVGRVRRELGQSQVILARKRRGKTALVQRLFNLIYTQNDPKVIPCYIRIDEGATTQLDFSVRLFTTLLSQYLGFKRRQPKLIQRPLTLRQLEETAQDPDLLLLVEQMKDHVAENKPAPAWELAREAGHIISSLKDERIIQIIDEFQFLNDRVYVKDDYQTLIELGSFYQRTGSSKCSPQIITGSYIGWLSHIVDRMVGRYDHYYLEPLDEGEALAAIYNYSGVLAREVSDESAAFMAEACYRDPFYIAQIFNSKCMQQDLTSPDNIEEILQYETSPKGGITKMWLEYLDHAFERINDRNAKEIVLYLARHGTEERDRTQILEDLKLDLSDHQLEKRLHKLAKADIIQRGSTNFYYQGLGDPVFAMVFRKTYEDEIERISLKDIEDDLSRQLKSLVGRVAFYKGISAEYRLINRLLFLGLHRTPLENIFRNAPPGFKLGSFASMGKHSFHRDQEQRVEIDIFGRAEHQNHPDLIVEVKDHADQPDKGHVEAFIKTKALLAERLERPTVFLFYSETGLADALVAELAQANIMFCDGTRLFQR